MYNQYLRLDFIQLRNCELKKYKRKATNFVPHPKLIQLIKFTQRIMEEGEQVGFVHKETAFPFYIIILLLLSYIFNAPPIYL